MLSRRRLGGRQREVEGPGEEQRHDVEAVGVELLHLGLVGRQAPEGGRLRRPARSKGSAGGNARYVNNSTSLINN